MNDNGLSASSTCCRFGDKWLLGLRKIWNRFGLIWSADKSPLDDLVNEDIATCYDLLVPVWVVNKRPTIQIESTLSCAFVRQMIFSHSIARRRFVVEFGFYSRPAGRHYRTVYIIGRWPHFSFWVGHDRSTLTPVHGRTPAPIDSDSKDHRQTMSRAIE